MSAFYFWFTIYVTLNLIALLWFVSHIALNHPEGWDDYSKDKNWRWVIELISMSAIVSIPAILFILAEIFFWWLCMETVYDD